MFYKNIKINFTPVQFQNIGLHTKIKLMNVPSGYLCYLHADCWEMLLYRHFDCLELPLWFYLFWLWYADNDNINDLTREIDLMTGKVNIRGTLPSPASSYIYFWYIFFIMMLTVTPTVYKHKGCIILKWGSFNCFANNRKFS